MSACEMGGGRTEPAPWFLRMGMGMGAGKTGPALVPVPEYRDTWGADAAPSDMGPDPTLSASQADYCCNDSVNSPRGEADHG